jgi:putative sterol carrier protein
MKNFTIYLVILVFLFVSKVLGQETFELRAKQIANKIEKITKEEKETLKEEVEAVNIQLSEGKITKEQADKRKKVLAEARAVIIEEKVTLAQNELNDLVQQKVE